MNSPYLKIILPFFLLFFLLLSCNQNQNKNTAINSAEKKDNGALIYKQYCITCHGKDGQLGLSGAANLATTTLTREERIEVITNGRKMMAPYGKILTQKQVGAVADYILSFSR